MTFGIYTFLAMAGAIVLLLFINQRTITMVQDARNSVALAKKTITVLQEGNSATRLEYESVVAGFKDGYVDILSLIRKSIYDGSLHQGDVERLEQLVSELAYIANFAVLDEKQRTDRQDLLIHGLTGSSIYALRDLYFSTADDYIPDEKSVTALRDRILAERRQLRLLQKATSYDDSVTGD